MVKIATFAKPENVIEHSKAGLETKENPWTQQTT
jgi:hypothetical protein